MLVCRRCATPHATDARFCDRCGAPLQHGRPTEADPLRRALLLGSAPTCDLVVAQDTVSGYHGLVLTDGPTACYHDLGSTNGSRLQGHPVPAGGVPLPQGEGWRLTLGTATVAADQLAAHLAQAPAGLLVGRDPTADFLLAAAPISTRHLLLTRRAGQLWAVDLGSRNGTFLAEAGGRRRLTAPTPLPEDAILFLGSYRLPLFLLEQTIARVLGPARTSPGSAPAPPAAIRLGDRPLIAGRDPARCDIVVAQPQVSGQHARLTRLPDGTCQVEDLGSSNGTFLDGQRIRQGILRPGGQLSLASVPLELDWTRGTVQAGSARGAVRLDARDLTRIVRDRRTGRPVTLVDQVSVSIYPSELVGLMGPSGAGKTTFMLSLNGCERPTTGQVLYNGEELYANFERFRGLIGYVPQDDILHRELTVREAVYYSARLRLPPDTGEPELRTRVDAVLEELELTEHQHKLIGTTEQKVLSGGQRKRVNLALELVTDPVLLFLDEPTSGLSAKDTAEVMGVLRRLADRGRTIIITIHQPSAEVYARMDQVILLAKGGKLAYFGPTEPDSYRYFGVGERQPDRIMAALDERTPAQWQERYRAAPEQQTYVRDRQAQAADPGALLAEVRRRSVPAPALRQWWILLCRYATTKLRDRANLLFLLAQAPLVAGLLALVFTDARQDVLSRGTPLFILCIAALFFGCMNGCRELVTERAIFRRERMVVLRLGPYLCSKFVLLGSIGLAQAALLVWMARVGVGLTGAPGWYLLVLTLTYLAATALGLAVSAVVRSAEAAMAAVPILLVFQIVLSGFLFPLSRPGREYIAALAAPMISRWSIEALLEVERRSLTDPAAPANDQRPRLGAADECGELPEGATPPQLAARATCRTGNSPEQQLTATSAWCWRCLWQEDQDLTPHRLGVDLALLSGFVLLLLALCFGLVRRGEAR